MRLAAIRRAQPLPKVGQVLRSVMNLRRTPLKRATSAMGLALAIAARVTGPMRPS